MFAVLEMKDDRSEKVKYDDNDYPIYLRDGKLSRYPGYSAPAHWHDDIEIIVVNSGTMQYNVNGEIITLHPGEGIFVNARQMHFGFSSEKSECDFICLLLHPALLSGVRAMEMNYILPVTRNASAPFVHLLPSVSWQAKLIEQSEKLFTLKQNPMKELRILSVFADLWSILFENLAVKADLQTAESVDLTIMKNMVGFIQKNYTEKLSLAEIAASGAIGQSKCCRLFAQYFKRSPVSYLNQYRLDKAIELLRSTDLSITQIALATGFSGASYFTESFREAFGVSPSVFRKNRT